MSTSESGTLPPELQAMIGTQTERTRAGVVEADGVRRFSQAIMDPDPCYWDAHFAGATRYGAVVAPPLYCTHFGLKTPAGAPDRLDAAFAHDPDFDGSSVAMASGPQTLPKLPTTLVRILNAGNEIELRRYPSLGEEVFSHMRYAEITAKQDKEGRPMLVVAIETIYSTAREEVLCIVRTSQIRR
ncbi:MAG: MaoC family dehydratase N-terminal domain-containing protein [Burkholderiaceae bacterium]